MPIRITEWRKGRLENRFLITCPKNRIGRRVIRVHRRSELKNPPHPFNDVTYKEREMLKIKV